MDATWLSRPNVLMPGEVFAERFRIERHLGSGALTTAFVVTAPGIAEPVCLKILHSRKATETNVVREWLALQQAIAQYQVPGIARIYDAGSLGDMAWCVMEYVSGPTLRTWLLEHLQFDTRVPAGLDILQALIRVLEHIHELGCYGVFKPENIFITPAGPVITDFGVPGFLTPQEFEFNAYARRYLPYMAPELRQDYANLLPQSDYYSLGAILYEILTGRFPGQPVRLPSSLSALFGIEADEIVLKSLAVEPRDRFGSTIGFNGALVALRDSLKQQRPEAFATSLVTPLATFEEVPTGTSAVHAPELVDDPNQDFEPPSATVRVEPATTFPAEAESPWSRPASLETVFQKPPEMTTLLAPQTDPEVEAPVMAAVKPATEVASPWAALEASISHDLGLGHATSYPGQAKPKPTVTAVRPFDEDWLVSAPTPTWVWVVVTVLGLVLTGIAGYLGFHYGH